MIESDNRQLLCTFSNINDFRSVAANIKQSYDIYNNRVFAFSNEKNPKEIYLTYNVLNIQKNSHKLLNTILIHRKKQTNTLYSLNALNVLIREENGNVDNTYIIDWSLYQNSLIITGDVSVRIIPLKIIGIVFDDKKILK